MLDRPGEWIDDLRGLNHEATTGFDELAAGAGVPSTATSTPAAGRPFPPPRRRPRCRPDCPRRTTRCAPTSPVTPLAQGWGEVLQGQLAKSDIYDVEEHVRASTGLTRPDFFNWPDALQDDVESHQPQVVVVTFGGNDGQPLKDDNGDVHDVTDPEWAAVYAARTGAVMDYLSAGGRKLIWVGVPNAKSDSLNQRMDIIPAGRQGGGREAPAGHACRLLGPPPGVRGGGFAEYIIDQDGVAKPMRANDGYHMTFAGYERWPALKEEIDRQLCRPRWHRPHLISAN